MASVLRAQREASARRATKRATRFTMVSSGLRRRMQAMVDPPFAQGSYALLPTDDRASVISQELEHLKSLQWHDSLPIVEDSGQEVTWAHHIMENWIFQVVIALVVVANAVVIGMETDHPKLWIWNWVEAVFLATFSFELAVRMYVISPRKFFSAAHGEFVWNIIDFVVVAIGIVDALGCLLGFFRDECENPTFRLVRALRILRIFKIVRFLRQLYMLAYGFIAAGKAVIWVTILMVFLLYICSVVLVWTLGPNSAHPSSTEVGSILEERFKTIPGSMLTLFQLMSQPDLMEYYPLFEEYWLLGIFLILFIIFGSFGMIAMLTGVITENMFEKNQLRVDEERKKREAQYEVVRSRCLELFDDLEETALNIHGEASKEVLATLVPKIIDLFETHLVEFTQHDLDGILDLMDVDGTGFIHKDEFCHGILSLAEGLRPMSAMEVMYAVVRNQVEIGECRELLEKISTEVISVAERQMEQNPRHSVSHTFIPAHHDSYKHEGVGKDEEPKKSELSDCRELLLKVAADVTHVAEWQRQDVHERQPPPTETRSSVAETINMQQSFGKHLHLLSSNMGAMARLQNELLEHSRALSRVSDAILQQVGDINAGMRRDVAAPQTFKGGALSPLSTATFPRGDAFLDQITSSSTPSPGSTRGGVLGEVMFDPYPRELPESPLSIGAGVRWDPSFDASLRGLRADAFFDPNLRGMGTSYVQPNGNEHRDVLPHPVARGLALTSAKPQPLVELQDGDKKTNVRRSPKMVTFPSDVESQGSPSPIAFRQSVRGQPRVDKVLVDDVVAQMRNMMDAHGPSAA